MALDPFWSNVQFAASEIGQEIDWRGLSPPGTGGQPEVFHPWLLPQTVDGYDESDFRFLPEPEQRTLAEAVARFREVARSIPPDRIPTTEETEKALDPFAEIARILEVREHPGAEDFRLSKRLTLIADRLRAEGYEIDRIEYKVDEDLSGEEALWLWVILPDQVTESDHFLEQTRGIRPRLEALLRRMDVRYFPHIRFRGETEQSRLGGGRR